MATPRSFPNALARFFWVLTDASLSASPDLTRRTDRSRELTVYEAGPHRWNVPGKRGDYYISHAADGSLRCACFDSVRGANRCKHVLAVEQALQSGVAPTPSRGSVTDFSSTNPAARSAVLESLQYRLKTNDRPQGVAEALWESEDYARTSLVSCAMSLPGLTRDEVLALLRACADTQQVKGLMCPAAGEQLLLALNIARSVFVTDSDARHELLRIARIPSHQTKHVLHTAAVRVLLLADAPDEQLSVLWKEICVLYPESKDQAAALCAVSGVARRINRDQIKMLLMDTDRNVRESMVRAMRETAAIRHWSPRAALGVARVRRRAKTASVTGLALSVSALVPSDVPVDIGQAEALNAAIGVTPKKAKVKTRSPRASQP